jgi:class 3 adenylate cyclase/tetratricopeptide (TPR) repeat protein
MPVCHACRFESAEPFKFCPECGTPAAAQAAAREQRKVVTVLFCDLTGSTAIGETLDPEPLRALLARYFDRMQEIVSRHGGTVEKFIGDAVMAVFGVPVVHEDDAVRAARAACEMRDALPDLGLNARIGVATGEVVTAGDEHLATGDVVNVAARLEQASAPGEILIGELTYALAGAAIDAEPVSAVIAKGKSQPVPAWRLLAVGGQGERQLAGPMVGRDRQLRLLRDVFASVRDDHACHLVTVLGAAGVGKSRLAAEVLREGVGDGQVVRGRCLSYGEGITYWPVIEVLQQLDRRPADAATARAIAGLLDESVVTAGAEEIAWAVRRTLEDAAAERPLICVLDDLHWAEPSLLDLIEHIADVSRGRSILLYCMARPELFDRRQGWAGGKMNATTILLEPLSPSETDRLIDALTELDPAVRARIRDAAGGNPLFVEEMLALLRASGSDEIAVPPSIQALLAARLDQLPPAERLVLETGAVEGQVFHRHAVETLAETTDLAGPLTGLIRKDLLRPATPVFAGDEAYGFRHILIRDAAYDALAKTSRATLHERYAEWLEQQTSAPAELDEIIGYHLEQVVRYRRELGLADDGGTAERARKRLTRAGRRARFRGDMHAALGLLSRASMLVPEREIDLPLEFDRLDTVFWMGRTADAQQAANELVDRTRAAGARAEELAAAIKAEEFRASGEPERSPMLKALVDEALPELTTRQHHFGLYVAQHALGLILNEAGLHDDQLTAYEEAFRQAELAQIPGLAEMIVQELLEPRAFGSTPAASLLAFTDELESLGRLDNSGRMYRATALAMLGLITDARLLMQDTLQRFRDGRATIPYGLYSAQLGSDIELMAGDLAAAVAIGSEGCRILDEAGERGWLCTGVAQLARNLVALERLDEAEARATWASRFTPMSDVVTQTALFQVRAMIQAKRGSPEQAVPIAMEAVAMSLTTQSLNNQASAYADLGDVYALAGRIGDAGDAYRAAAEHYGRKGNVVMQERVRRTLGELGADARPG